jgi:myo-inositol-1(or 4)-monophosphatase
MISDQDLAARYLAALGIAQELGRQALRFFGDSASLDVSMKGSQDWLTVADGAIETLFRKAIADAFPGDAVVGEEHGGADHDRLWIIDPIDGTANFARGDRLWCLSIGLVADGVPELGIIHAPALDETFAARRGRGATLNGAPIRAASTNDMKRAVVEFGWSPRLPTELHLAGVAGLYAAGASVKRSGSGALGIAAVACGRIDAYAELHINSWDAAAGIVIAHEAGARVSDFACGDWIASGNPLLVATPALYDDIWRTTGLAAAPRPVT